MVKRLTNKIRNSIWLYPTLYSLGALVLALGIAMIDRIYSDDMVSYIHVAFYTTTSLAQSVLAIVAGAFITIATFTFSTTMVVLTMYASQFTPRVVENFLNNQTTMKSFGVFLSGFIYSIVSLLLINTNEDGHLVLAASVAVVYIIVGLIYFLIFIHSVSTHIQATGLIMRLHQEAVNKINDYYNFVKTSDVITHKALQVMIRNQQAKEAYVQTDGYIQEIDYNRLKKIAQNHDLILCFRKVVGQFVTSETRMMTIYHHDQITFDEDFDQAIKACVYTGNKRTEAQDFSFTIQKIVEIALKALSPGINDPNTAIHCLNIIGGLLKTLAQIENGYIVLKEEAVHGCIVLEAYDFQMLLFDAYHQIMHYGQEDATVMISVMKSLRSVKNKASQENKKQVDAYANYIYEKLNAGSFDALEMKKIQKEYEDIIA